MILSQLEKNICKIYEANGNKGTGFLCKITYPDQFNLLPVLITNNHVIKLDDLQINKTIKITFDDDKIIKILNIDESRITFTDEDIDVTIIGINTKLDGIYNFLDVDENIFNNYNYKDKEIYILQYPNGQKSSFSTGMIKDIMDKNLQYCSTDFGSSGSPIINLSSYKVIGIHKRRTKFKFNEGTFIKYAIEEFKKKYSLNNNNNKFSGNSNNYYPYNKFYNNNCISYSGNKNNNFSIPNINRNNNFNYNAFNNNTFNYYYGNKGINNPNNNFNINQNYNNIQSINNPNYSNNLNNGNNNAYNNNLNNKNSPSYFNYQNNNQININCIQNNQNLNQIQNSINSQYPQNSQNPLNPSNQFQNPKYYFPLKGLNNIGSTFYMNATLQCLLHISELVEYFLTEYQNYSIILKTKNKYVESGGNLSRAFYELVKGVVLDEDNSNKSALLNSKTKIIKKGSRKNNDNEPKAYSPDNFRKILGYYNSQFRRFEANDYKDLILYLLQTMHEELNYFGDYIIPRNIGEPNQLNRAQTFLHFNNTYNVRNCSIISILFYGTYENTTICKLCNNTIYNFQKFEFVSFGMFGYHKKTFNIYDGFKDNEKTQILKGDNQFYCNICRKLCDAERYCRIITPPNKLLINIDYGKNKKFQPSKVEFDEIIDITKYVSFNFGCQLKYKIIGVCTHLGYSGSSVQYISYCKHRLTGQWYYFSDFSCKECNGNEIYGGSPYLLLYEKLNI